MFRITFKWGGFNVLEYRITDDPFFEIDSIYRYLPNVVIVEVI
jgi:hypothetical protein